MRRTRWSGLRTLALGVGLVALAALPAVSGAHGTHAGRAKDVTLTYWNAYSADSPEENTIEKVVIPGFEASHPGITVKSVNIPYDDLHQKLLTATAGGDLPDVVRSDIIWVPELAKLGVLAPLDRSCPTSRRSARRSSPDRSRRTCTRGTTTASRSTRTPACSCTTAPRSTAAGIKQPPATFADLEAMAPKLKAQGHRGLRRQRHERLEPVPLDLVRRRRGHQRGLTKATGYLERHRERGRRAAARRTCTRARSMPGLIIGDKGSLATSDGLPKGKYATILDGPWMFPIFSTLVPEVRAAHGARARGPGRLGQRRRRRGHRDDEQLAEQGRRRAVHRLHADPGRPARDGEGRSDDRCAPTSSARWWRSTRTTRSS